MFFRRLYGGHTPSPNPLFEKVLSTEILEPPPPWRKVGGWAIAGRNGAGFARGTEFFVVAGTNGRGVFDCEIGEKVFRDREEYGFETHPLEVVGVGPIDGAVVPVEAIWVGGLLHITPDHWELEFVVAQAGREEILLVDPASSFCANESKYANRSDRFFGIASDTSRNCWAGFSDSGRSMVLCTEADLDIFSRTPDEPS